MLCRKTRRVITRQILSKTADHLKLATVAWLKEPFGSWLAKADNQVTALTAITAPNSNYTLPANSSSVGPCTEDTWTATSAPPDGRVGHTAVWTGSEMIVWGGFEPGFFLVTPFNTGGRYNPSTNAWIATSTTNAPDGRSSHTAVWNGSEMIVWGGHGDFDSLGYYFNTGGRYDPGTDSWTATSTVNAPEGRYSHTAVWTGNEIIVWGGILYPTVLLARAGDTVRQVLRHS